MVVPARGSRALPEHPNLRHLKDQAKALMRTGAEESLTRAQFRVAREYGFDSWSKLRAHVELLHGTGQLKAAIDSEDLPLVVELMTRNVALHQAPLGYHASGPLTWVAECRTVEGSPSRSRLEMARWMIEHGSDVHQRGDGPLMRAALNDDRIPMMELLVAHGADVNAVWNGYYPIICGPCECLAPRALDWLLTHGANPNVVSPKYGAPIAMLIQTYARDARAKHDCLEVFAQHGYVLPDAPCMALHRGRIDLLSDHLKHDPQLLSRPFSLGEIFPAQIGLNPSEGLHLTPVGGSTLLHLAIEYDDIDVAKWLLANGADANARAAVDGDGFGAHTPLFHAVVTLGARDDSKARLLLEHGADPNARATLRKQLRDTGSDEKEELAVFPAATPIAYAKRFQEQRFVSQAALALLAAHGGVE